MARYFFHLHECGDITRDDEGRLLDSQEMVRAVAVREARAMMCAEMEKGQLCLACFFLIEDDSGTEILRLNFRDAVTITGL